MLAGVALGWLNPRLGADMKPLGDGFIALVRMIIGPVIFCTVVNGVGAANDFKKVGRVALKALVYFEVVTLIALVFALVGVNLWGPGVGMNVDLKTVDAHSVAEYAAQAKHQTIPEYLLHIIPDTFASAFSTGAVLQVLFVSVLFAFALGLSGDKGEPVRKLVESASAVFFRMPEPSR